MNVKYILITVAASKVFDVNQAFKLFKITVTTFKAKFSTVIFLKPNHKAKVFTNPTLGLE